MNIGIFIICVSKHLYHSYLNLCLVWVVSLVEKNHFLFWSCFGRCIALLRYSLSIWKGLVLFITINWLGLSGNFWEGVGEAGGESCVIYLGCGIFVVKSTLSSLIDDFREFTSKNCLGGEEILFHWTKILLLYHSSLFRNWMVIFLLSYCMIKRGFLFWISFERAN